ncbi:MAG: DUF6600 domain-containing protein [Myxococcaceae bacterium]
MRIHSLSLLLPLVAAVLVPTAAGAQEPEVSVSYHETLSPYGDWVVVQSYGRVWRPHRRVVGVGFVPYATGGRWVHGGMGWAFEARWSWGWLPFHYGRWYEDQVHGWVWVPDDVWAPAWVDWRFGGGYVGWVPIGPRYHASARWYFVESQHFVQPEIWRYRTTAVSEHDAYQVTRSLPRSRGPDLEQVRAGTRLQIPERRLEAPPRPQPSRRASIPSEAQPARSRAPEPAREPQERSRVIHEPSRPQQEPFRPMVEPPRPMPIPQQRPTLMPVPQQQVPPPNVKKPGRTRGMGSSPR